MTQISATTQKPQEKKITDYKVSNYQVDTFSLEFDLNDTKTSVKAISTMTQSGLENEPLFLFGIKLELVSLLVDGKAYFDHKLVENGILISNLPQEFTLEINTIINPQDNKSCEGLYKSDGAYCTQCEAEGFRRITYYLDRPDILAKFTTKITADKEQYPSLLSNGNCVAKGDLDNGRHFVTWVDPFPKPSYLFALVAGDFDCLKDKFTTKSGRSVDLEIFVDKGNLNKAKHAMVSLQKSMSWDEERFNFEYDLDIYMIVAVDFFNMGAMENKGLNIFNSKFVLADQQSATDQDYLGIEAVIGHEYFHNWTGNRITCRDWFQLSLKEGLTVFRDQEFSSDLGSRSMNRIANVKIMRNSQFAEDAGPMSHPIRPQSVMEMNNFYTLTVYEKGSEVIRMLHTLLGEEKFQQGIALYVQRHDGHAVTCDDFVQAMSDASGIDLTLFKLWYSQSGTPIVNITDSYDEKSNRYQLTFAQTTPPTSDQKEKQALHIPVNIELIDNKGEAILLSNNKTKQTLSLTEAEQTFVFENITEKPTPSLFCGFSAPVKYNYAYTETQLTHLLTFANDDFSSWDAGQILFNNALIKNVALFQNNKPMEISKILIEGLKYILENEEIDPYLVADMFDFGTETGSWGLFDKVDIEAIYQARKFMHKEIATQLHSIFVTVFNKNQQNGPYEISTASIAKRKLANCALSFIGKADPILANKLVLNQSATSNNMTDGINALSVANTNKLDCRDRLMDEFSEKWSENGLVMDKWFALQATLDDKDVIEKIKELFFHPSFTFENPNRVRSLIGAFVQNNSYNFHALDGSGYKFLTEQLIHLNESNPQVAARLITPLIQFKQLDETRQELMKAQLNRLLELDDLAIDLYEKVTKALAQ